MDLDKLLELEYSKENIRALDRYLAKTDKNSIDYLKALCHKLKISPTNKLNDSLKQIYSYVPEFPSLQDEEVILICDTIMALVLKANRLDEYEKYMLIKAKRMQVNSQKLLYYDRFIFYRANKNYSQAVIEIKGYLSEDLTDKEREKGLNDIIDIAYENKNYDLYFSYIKQLMELEENLFNTTKIKELKLKTIEMLDSSGNYDKTLKEVKAYLEDDSLTNKEKLVAARILLSIYLRNNELRMASILEADYADYLENNNESLEFCLVALELYQKTNHQMSIRFYEDKIKEIRDSFNAPVKEKKNIYVIPSIIEEETTIPRVEENVYIKPKPKVEKFKDVTIASNLFEVNKLVKLFNKEDLRLRDFLRDLGYILEHDYHITRFNVIYKVNKYYLHSYKNNKLYDRIYQELPDSFIVDCYKSKEILILDSELKGESIEIFTNKEYLEDYVVAYPLIVSNEAIGAFEVCFKDDILGIDNNFDIFSLLAEILTLRIFNETNFIKLKDEYYLKDYVINNFYYGVKIIKDKDIIVSPLAKSIYRLEEDININEFYNYIYPSDLVNYKNTIKSLYKEPRNNITIEYKYNKDNVLKDIKEIFYTIIKDDIYYLISIVLDNTKDYSDIRGNLSSAYKDNISGFDNINKLYHDMDINKEKRYSIAIYGSDDVKEYSDLYGINFYHEFLQALYNNVSLFIKDYYNCFSYMIDECHFALMITDIKDKRKEESFYKKFINYINNSFIDLKYSVYPEFKLGFYPHAKEEHKEIEAIYEYAYNAYLDAKDYGYIASYNFKNYRNRFKEKEKYLLLRENILNNQINIKYIQLIDVLNNEVYGYIIRLNMPNLNIYEDEVEDILKKHDKYELYHKYKLRSLCLELKKLSEQIEAYIAVMVEYSNELIDDNFSDFVLTQLNFYKVPPEVLTLVVDHYDSRLDILRDNKIKIITKDIYDVLNKKVDSIYLDLNKLDVNRLYYISKVFNELNTKIYLANVDDKSNLNLIKEAKIDYIYGRVYSKAYTINDLINKLKD